MFYRLIVLLLLFPGLVFAYTVVRKDGKSFSGELVKQTPEETILKDKQGVVLKFKASQIDWEKTTQSIRKGEADAAKEEKKVEKVSRDIISIHPQERWIGEKITFDFKDLDIRDFFLYIADLADMNIILDPEIKGSLTLKMNEVPWDQVLDVVCRTYGLGYEIYGNVVSVDKY